MLGNGDSVSRILVLDSSGRRVISSMLRCLNFETESPVPLGMILIALRTGLEVSAKKKL
jgi:hypothetical protein